MITIYGIKNCNTVQKVLLYLNEHNINYTFHDFKKSGIDATTVEKWCTTLGWETLVNKKGTTWRKLTEEEKNSIIDQASAVTALCNNTSMIKRPVITKNDEILGVGYDETILAKL